MFARPGFPTGDQVAKQRPGFPGRWKLDGPSFAQNLKRPQKVNMNIWVGQSKLKIQVKKTDK
jgi:hypothetical protein